MKCTMKFDLNEIVYKRGKEVMLTREAFDRLCKEYNLSVTPESDGVYWIHGVSFDGNEIFCRMNYEEIKIEEQRSRMGIVS